MARAYVTLDRCVVAQTTEKAIGVRKSGFTARQELTWLPRSLVRDGDSVDVGETDICVPESIADEKDLDY